MKDSDSQDAFINSTNEELVCKLRELHSMEQADILLLKQEFINREMFEESFAIDTFFSDRFDPSKLSLKELQELVSERLQTGESIESIKLDLADHGITFENMINKEGERMDAIHEKIQTDIIKGKDQAIIDAELKQEYNYTEEEVVEVKKNLKNRSRLYLIISIGIGLLYAARLLMKMYLH